MTQRRVASKWKGLPQNAASESDFRAKPSIFVDIHEESEEEWTKTYAIVTVEINLADENNEFFDWYEMRAAFMRWVVDTIGMKARKDVSIRLFDRVVTGRWKAGDYALLFHGPGGHIGEIEFYRMSEDDAKVLRKSNARRALR